MNHKKFTTAVLGVSLLLSTIATTTAQEISLETLSNGLVTTTGSWVTGDWIQGGAMKFDLYSGTITDCEDSVTAVQIPDAINGSPVLAIGAEAFLGKTALESVTFPDSLVTIGTMAFAECTGLTSLTLPDNVTHIDDRAFIGCSNLQNITLPTLLQSIGYQSFSHCESLQHIHIPQEVSYIDPFAFQGTKLALTVSAGSPYFSTQDGVLYDYDYTTMHIYPEGLTRVHYNLPDTVYTILECAYQGDTLQSIGIPTTLHTVKAVAFPYSPLTDVYYAGSESDWGKVDINRDYDDNGNSNFPLYQSNIYYEVSLPERQEVAYWALPYAEYVRNTGINPTLDGITGDEEAIRGEVATYIYNMAGNGMDILPTHSFEDIQGYEKPIAWIQNVGIMNGESPTYFATNKNVSREQFALILRQLALYQGKDVTATTAGLYDYTDIRDISTWAVDALSWAVQNGLMSGVEGQLNPQGDITQIQIAVMLYRYSLL